METVNKLAHTISTFTNDGDPMNIYISLDDDCKNGHIDFSITGDIYKKDNPRIDKYFISGGCIHEEILKVKPELKIFVSLHLADAEGNPMYAVQNGFYHLQNGFNNIGIDSPEFLAKFCDYYRMNEQQFNVIKDSKNTTQYAINLVSCGVVANWKKEALEAISILEGMTGKKFVDNSQKSNFKMPTEDEINEDNKKKLSGYYSKKEEKKREKQRINDIILKLKKDFDKKIEAEKTEFLLKKQVILIAGEEAEKNCIFYTHTKTLTFNWMESYKEVTQETINKIAAKIKLPQGVTIENKNKFKK